jgi:YgiT-type zinc finger domain-containing protein
MNKIQRAVEKKTSYGDSFKKTALQEKRGNDMFFYQGCPMCGGDQHPGTTTFTVDRKTVLIVVRNVPAIVCTQCGEAWIQDTISEELERIVTEASTKRRQL